MRVDSIPEKAEKKRSHFRFSDSLSSMGCRGRMGMMQMGKTELFNESVTVNVNENG